MGLAKSSVLQQRELCQRVCSCPLFPTESATEIPCYLGVHSIESVRETACQLHGEFQESRFKIFYLGVL